MKRYTFPVTLSGIGHDVEQAWRDAVEQFGLDPGEPDSVEVEVETGPGPFDESQEDAGGEIYRCQDCDWKGEDAVPARDVLARHAPGDVFSDLECPECGALVQPSDSADAEDRGELVKLALQLEVAYQPNGVPESRLRRYLDQIAERAAGEGLLTGDSEAEVEDWSYRVLSRDAVSPPLGKENGNSRLVAILIYEHRHGREVSAYAGYDKAWAELAEIVREQWKDRADRSAPDDPSGLTDDEAIGAYFEGHDEEFYDIEEIEVDFED